MQLHVFDWIVILLSVAATAWVGVRFTRRAGTNLSEYFLAGRTLPWWIAGTSMVATSFSCDTPLVVSGWVRDGGIWKNWLWWGYAISGMLGAFLFAPLWRRGGLMTKAEFAELRYGGPGARILRAFLGVMHSGVVNTITLCWVLLSAAKILDVLFGVDRTTAMVLACSISVAYSMAAGLWGVVLTDILQFVMALVGALILGVVSWSAVGGVDGVRTALDALGSGSTRLDFVPSPGPGFMGDLSFWTAPFTAFVVYLGVWWWAVESVDGTGPGVQRVLASRTEKDGLLATMWFNVAHYALRPWPWIMVALASLVVLPHEEVRAPSSGQIVAVNVGESVEFRASDGTQTTLSLRTPHDSSWTATPSVRVGAKVSSGDLLAATDSERAYIVMMQRFLPAGLLGLLVASLLAAFMSTVDTHVNLAASFFVNDLYRRFLRPLASETHYILVARLASLGVMTIGALLALQADSIADLFVFLMAFLGGVGPIYLLRWFWWRITATTEIVASLASALTTIGLTFGSFHFNLGPLSPDGVLSDEGRILLVVLVSFSAALLSLLLGARPDPATLVEFFKRVRPMGAWGPVRVLCPEVSGESVARAVWAGCLGGLALTYGLLFFIGHLLLDRPMAAAWCLFAALAGGVMTAWAVRHRETT